MSQASKGNNIKSSGTDEIISFLHTLNYSKEDFKDYICLPLAQLLHDNKYSIEDTGVIVTSFANISKTSLEDIYNPNTVSLYDTSDLIEFLTKEEFEQLESIVNPPQKVNKIHYIIDDDTKIDVDFLNQKVYHVREYLTGKGETKTKSIPVIEAVPHEIVVYDSNFLETTRTFRITWKSKHSKRLFVTQSENGGATIKDIEAMLINAGYTHNKRMLSDVLSIVINSMIDEGLATIKDSIDNKGVYYYNDKVLIVKLNTTEPSKEEIHSALSVLEQLHKAYRKETKTLATVLKWSLCSVFSYARKQAGANWFPWLYLVGAGQSGKTTLAKIGAYFYDLPREEMNIGGASFNSDYRIGLNVSRDCCLTIVNEPKGTFKNEDTIETVKNSVELKVCRKVQNKIYYAFSPVVFTSNGFIPEMDSLYRRIYIIDFEYKQRKSKTDSRKFEKEFNVEAPAQSCLKELQVLGRLALREVMSNPSLLSDDWKDLADNLITSCYSKVDKKVPEWLTEWSKDKELSDLDNVIIEEIQSVLSKELYNARNRTIVSDEYEMKQTSSKSSDFEGLYWYLLNNRAFSWALPHHPWGREKNIFLNQGFKKLLQKDIDELGSLKSISQLLGWEYKKVRFNKSDKRGILVPFKDFMEFVYPSVDDES